MQSVKQFLTTGITVMLFGTTGLASAATWDSFIIREGGGNPPTINDLGGGQTEFVVTVGGMKAAIGTSAIDGTKLGDIQQLAITRHDDRTVYAAGSGPHVAPYLNVWITDGLGNFAVVANEPSNPAFQPLYSNGYNLTWSDLEDKVAKIYENNDKSWLPNNGIGLTFADLANFTILAPTQAELTLGWAGLGSGAPRELGTNDAYGINWVFGDTLANYVSGQDGYIVSDPVAVTASSDAEVVVPEPTVASLAMLGLAAIAMRRRRVA